MDTLSLALIWWMAVPTTLYAFWYGVSAPWWRKWIGRASFISAAALALMVDLTLIFRVWPPSGPVLALIVVVIFFSIGFAKLVLFVALVRAQIRQRRNDQEAERPALSAYEPGEILSNVLITIAFFVFVGLIVFGCVMAWKSIS